MFLTPTVIFGVTRTHFGLSVSLVLQDSSLRSWQRRFLSSAWGRDAVLVMDLHAWRCLSSWPRCSMGWGLKAFLGRSWISALILVWLWNRALTGSSSPPEFSQTSKSFSVWKLWKCTKSTTVNAIIVGQLLHCNRDSLHYLWVLFGDKFCKLCYQTTKGKNALHVSVLMFDIANVFMWLKYMNKYKLTCIVQSVSLNTIDDNQGSFKVLFLHGSSPPAFLSRHIKSKTSLKKVAN